MPMTHDHRCISEVVHPRALEHLPQFQSDARRHLPGRVERVVLFGSRARGDARRGSDYDVAVFVKGLSDRRPVDHVLADLAYPHILAGVHIRPISLPVDYLETVQRGILQVQIARDGLVVADA